MLVASLLFFFRFLSYFYWSLQNISSKIRSTGTPTEDQSKFNSLNANSKKWSNTLKEFVGNLPKNCLSVFDHFVGLVLKGLRSLELARVTSKKIYISCVLLSFCWQQQKAGVTDYLNHVFKFSRLYRLPIKNFKSFDYLYKWWTLFINKVFDKKSVKYFSSWMLVRELPNIFSFISLNNFSLSFL